MRPFSLSKESAVAPLPSPVKVICTLVMELLFEPGDPLKTNGSSDLRERRLIFNTSKWPKDRNAFGSASERGFEIGTLDEESMTFGTKRASKVLFLGRVAMDVEI